MAKTSYFKDFGIFDWLILVCGGAVLVMLAYRFLIWYTTG